MVAATINGPNASTATRAPNRTGVRFFGSVANPPPADRTHIVTVADLCHPSLCIDYYKDVDARLRRQDTGAWRRGGVNAVGRAPTAPGLTVPANPAIAAATPG